MEGGTHPVLCGGTFLTLLLRARKQPKEYRKHYPSALDVHRDRDLLYELIKICDRTYKKPHRGTSNDKSFGSITTRYLNCEISKSVYLPFTETENIDAFDARVKNKNEYQTILHQMQEVIGNFLDPGEKVEKLVKGLLELISLDKSIKDTETANNSDKPVEFFVCQDGRPTKKSAFTSNLYDNSLPAFQICLPALLLGIWHFIVVKRRDNTIGRETYIGNIEKEVKRKIELVDMSDDVGFENESVFGTGTRSIYGMNGKELYDDMSYNQSPTIARPIELGSHNNWLPVAAHIETISFVADENGSFITQDNNEEIKALLNGQSTQATKDDMCKVVDDEILPELRDKLRKPMLCVYDLIMNSPKGTDKEASSELGNFMQFIDTEVLDMSVPASHMMRLSGHKVYNSLLMLRRFVEDYIHNVTSTSFGDSYYTSPSYTTRHKQEELESLIFEIFGEDEEE